MSLVTDVTKRRRVRFGFVGEDGAISDCKVQRGSNNMASEPFSRRFRERNDELLKRKKENIEKIIRQENNVRIMIFKGMIPV